VTEHVRGASDAPVTLVEYGDYECPYCAAAAPVLRQLVDESEGRVRLIFRNFPLADRHPYALTAALAAEAAGAQGDFWSMHDLLFERQDRLGDRALSAYADALGLDGGLVVGRPAQAFGDRVEADFAGGLAAGVEGTPTLFIDGARYTGRMEIDVLRRAVGGRTDGSGSRSAPGTGRQRRWSLGFRRAQRETVAEQPQEEHAEDRGGH
jgi:protein-disulfide isomerase